jgi:S-adenosylmethionine/arginine decarboxylase-like enzyme
MKDLDYWGWELTVDCSGCNDKILSKEDVAQFSRELVELIDMKAYGEPQVVHFADHDPSKAGFTLVQLIETSSIVAHFVDDYHLMFCNIFSCKPFDPDAAIAFVKEFFGVKNVHYTFAERRVPVIDEESTA